MNNEPFKVRAYGYGELALLYFPNITEKCASRQLSIWIVTSESLSEKLKAARYVKGRRLFTPMQDGLIVGEFGEPRGIQLLFLKKLNVFLIKHF
ncbi:MAG: DUF4248 domain-containing protein [Flavobacterium sp.]|jgi:hypothetical protein|nr:DUF4248 domain-containing protein [Flavobacterium sp.]